MTMQSNTAAALSAFKAELGAEILKAARSLEFLLPTLLFPVAFYLLFAVMLGGGNAGNAAYLLATYGVFAAIGPAILGFGIALATEREMGWLTLKRILPTSIISYLGAKTLATLLFCALSIGLLYAAGGFLGGVELPRRTWTLLFFVHVASAVPFTLIGLLIGLLCKSGAAAAFGNIAFMGLAVLGGLWIPVTVFPDILQTIAGWLPSYHLGEASLIVAGVNPADGLWGHLGFVAIVTAVLAINVGIAWNHQKS